MNSTLTAHEESTHAGDVLGELNLVNFELMDLVVTTGHHGRLSALNKKLASRNRTNVISTQITGLITQSLVHF